MKTRPRRQIGRRTDSGQALFGGTGWLFADLMVALAMAFLVATTVGFPPVPVRPPAHPRVHQQVPGKHPVTKPPPPALDFNYVKISVDIDVSGLLSGSPAAIATVRNAVLAKHTIKSRIAGLVLLYGGNNPQGSPAIPVDYKVENVLKELGKKNFVFQVAVYREFVDDAQPPSFFHMDVYLFKTS